MPIFVVLLQFFIKLFWFVFVLFSSGVMFKPVYHVTSLRSTGDE